MREIGRRQGENMDIESLEYLQTWRDERGRRRSVETSFSHAINVVAAFYMPLGRSHLQMRVTS